MADGKSFAAIFVETRLFLTEGAIGTRLSHEHGLEFDPHIKHAGFIYDGEKRAILTELYRGYLRVAGESGLPMIMVTTTRRVNKESAAAAGVSETLFADFAAYMRGLIDGSGAEGYIGGVMGCKGDAYTGEGALSESEAEKFHAWTAEAIASSGADFCQAVIMPTLPETKGMAGAIARTGMPYIVSFTMRGNGRLADGTTLHDAIRAVDDAAPQRPLCYMSNCAHPTVLMDALRQPFNQTAAVRERFMGLQANTSPLPPEALDGAERLHESAPEELARDMLALHAAHPLKIAGGCCGTNEKHIAAIARALGGAL